MEQKEIIGTKCITFDTASQKKLPDEVKLKIKENMQKIEDGYTQHVCTDCKRYSLLHEKDRDGILLGFCTHCGHPIWQ